MFLLNFQDKPLLFSLPLRSQSQQFKQRGILAFYLSSVGRSILLNPFLFKGEHESNNSAARQGWPGSLYRAPFLVHALQDKALRPAKLIPAGSLT